MRREDLPKLLTIEDRLTYLLVSLATKDAEGKDGVLWFRYTDAGLWFDAKHYHGWAPMFHGYDEHLYTDALIYLEPVATNNERRTDWAIDICERARAVWMRNRCRVGQAVSIWDPDISDGGGTEDQGVGYLGFIKKVDGESIVVAYDGGRQLTAKLKKTKKGLDTFVARNGVTVSLGGPVTLP